MSNLFSDQTDRSHAKHRIHPHTRKSWNEAKARLKKRKTMIIDSIIIHGRGTDRDIMKRLGFVEPNTVRPSITGLIEDMLLEESGSIKCPLTGKKVRVVSLPKSIEYRQ